VSERQTKIHEQGAQNVHSEKVLDQHVEDGEEGQCRQHQRSRRRSQGFEGFVDAVAVHQVSAKQGYNQL
jgi:hypothetical protein